MGVHSKAGAGQENSNIYIMDKHIYYVIKWIKKITHEWGFCNLCKNLKESSTDGENQ